MGQEPSEMHRMLRGETQEDAPIRGSATPSDLHIQSRNRHFSAAELENRYWVGGDPFGTAFFNALSVTFPKGESFFMEVLRGFIKDTPEKLKREIRAFCHQEAVHSREHACFNKQLEDSSYDISKLEASVDSVFERVGKMTRYEQLAVVACLEHMTAILAKEFIANPTHLAFADEDQRNLWLWHASEEIEHKGVAYDTWLHVTRGWSRWKRWAVKSKYMALISVGFAKNRSKGILELLRQDGITGPKAWSGFLKYVLIGPAPFTRTLIPWAKFFLPGFHPWNEDDRDLIQRAESEYEAAIMDATPGHEPTVAELADKLKKIKLPKVA